MIMFSTSSLLGTAVDMLVLWLCSHYLFEGYVQEYILSPFISFECAVLTNFTIAYFFIWKDRVSHRGRRSFLRHFLGYNFSSFGVFLLKLGVMQAFHFTFPQMNILICNFLALCVSGGVNFVMNEWVIFRKTKSVNQSENDSEHT